MKNAILTSFAIVLVSVLCTSCESTKQYSAEPQPSMEHLTAEQQAAVTSKDIAEAQAQPPVITVVEEPEAAEGK